MPQKKYAEAVDRAHEVPRPLYREQAGRQFSNQQDAQQYRRDRLTEIDEVIRQYQSGPQTAQTTRGDRQLTENRRLMQENLQRGTTSRSKCRCPSFVSMALGSAYLPAGTPRRR